MSLCHQLRENATCPDTLGSDLILLAEATANAELLARLEFHGIEHQCLWHLQRSAGLERYAPWLFRLVPGSDLDNWLGSSAGQLPFTALATAMPVDALARHLRRFGKLQQGSKRYWLRLGNPHALSLYVESLAHQAEQLAQLFDHGRLRTLYFHAPETGLAISVQPLFEQLAQTCERQEHLAWLVPAKAPHQ